MADTIEDNGIFLEIGHGRSGRLLKPLLHGRAPCSGDIATPAPSPAALHNNMPYTCSILFAQSYNLVSNACKTHLFAFFSASSHLLKFLKAVL